MTFRLGKKLHISDFNSITYRQSLRKGQFLGEADQKHMVVKKPQSMRVMFRNMDPDKKAESYIEKRLQKVNRIIKNVLEFEVEISLDKKGKYLVELMVKTPYALYRAEEISESIEGSADIACEELTTQIVKDKSKMVDLKRRGARSLKKKLVLDEDSRFKK